jgi:hypothetical protein
MNPRYYLIIIGILVAVLAVVLIVNSSKNNYEEGYGKFPVDNTSHETNNENPTDDHGSPAVFTQELKFGMEDNDQIKKMQEYLIARGYLNGNPNGDFYSYTKAAVLKFQVASGLTPTGIVDLQTRAALNRAEGEDYSSAESPCDLNVSEYQVVSFPLAITGQFYIGNQQSGAVCPLGLFEGYVGAVHAYSSTGASLNASAPLMIHEPNFDYSPGAYDFNGTLNLTGVSSGDVITLRFEKEDPSGEHPYHFDIPVVVQ